MLFLHSLVSTAVIATAVPCASHDLPARRLEQMRVRAFARVPPEHSAELARLRRSITTAERRVLNARAVDPKMTDILSTDVARGRRAFALMKMVKADQRRNRRAIAEAKYRMNTLLTKYLAEHAPYLDRLVGEAAACGLKITIDRRGWDVKNLSIEDGAGRSVDFWSPES